MKDARTEREVYPIRIVFPEKEAHLLWVSDPEGDYFLRNSDGNRLASFVSRTDASEWSVAKNIAVHWDETTTLDVAKFLGVLELMRQSGEIGEKGCEVLLNGWNLITDLLKSLEQFDEADSLRSEILDKVYSKLFWGNNIQAIKPNNAQYTPLWDMDEAEIVETALKSALQVCESNLDVLH